MKKLLVTAAAAIVPVLIALPTLSAAQWTAAVIEIINQSHPRTRGCTGGIGNTTYEYTAGKTRSHYYIIKVTSSNGLSSRLEGRFNAQGTRVSSSAANQAQVDGLINGIYNSCFNAGMH